MDRKKMLRISWKPYMSVMYQSPRMEYPVECMVIMINFDDELLILRPIDIDEYEDDDVNGNLEYCELPTPQMQISHVEGKRKKDIVRRERLKKFLA